MKEISVKIEVEDTMLYDIVRKLDNFLREMLIEEQINDFRTVSKSIDKEIIRVDTDGKPIYR